MLTLNPSLQRVRAFVCVVQRQSFALAARDMQMTASSISRLVKALEAELGVLLIHRTTRAMSLTVVGQGFYDDCTRVFEQLQSACDTARSTHSSIQGPLKLSIPVVFGGQYVVPYLAGFLKLHPQLQLELLVADRYVDVVAEGVTLALRIGQMEDSGLVAQKLLFNRRILVAAPAYLCTHPKPSVVDELKHHNCLQVTLNRDGEVWRLNGPGGTKSLRVGGCVRTDSGDAARRLAIDAVGIAFLSEVNVAKSLLDGTLLRVLPEWSGPDSGVYAMRAARPMARGAQALLSYLRTKWLEDGLPVC